MVDIEALQAERKQIEDACIQIECQILGAKQKAHANKEYADPTWFYSANLSLKKKRQRFQELSILIAQSKRGIKSNTHTLRTEKEIGIIKSILAVRLSEDFLKEIYEELDERMAEAGFIK